MLITPLASNHGTSMKQKLQRWLMMVVISEPESRMISKNINDETKYWIILD